MTRFRRAAYNAHVPNIRNLQAHAINRRLKQLRVRQSDIAAKVGTSVSFVSTVIRRKAKDTELTQRVWQELERVLQAEEVA